MDIKKRWIAFKGDIDDHEDFPSAVAHHAPHVVRHLIDKPDEFGISSWRSHSVSKPKQRDGEAPVEGVLLIVRGHDVEKRPVVLFIQGQDCDQVWIELCYRAAHGEIKWKDDQPRNGSNGKGGFMDAITSPKGQRDTVDKD